MATDDDKDPTIKQLLASGKPLEEVVDAVTAAELEKWFALPSFTEVAERAEVDPDPDTAAVREQRAKAIAAVDPALLDAHAKRIATQSSAGRFKPIIDVRVDPSITLLDLTMIERQHVIAEPREVEIPVDLQDDLRECTPQALLRDLHRAELEFEKTFEIVDMAAEQRLDIVAAVNDAMLTSWKLPALGNQPYADARILLDEVRAERKTSWPDLFKAVHLPNRRVTE